MLSLIPELSVETKPSAAAAGAVDPLSGAAATPAIGGANTPQVLAQKAQFQILLDRSQAGIGRDAAQGGGLPGALGDDLPAPEIMPETQPAPEFAPLTTAVSEPGPTGKPAPFGGKSLPSGTSIEVQKIAITKAPPLDRTSAPSGPSQPALPIEAGQPTRPSSLLSASTPETLLEGGRAPHYITQIPVSRDGAAGAAAEPARLAGAQPVTVALAGEDPAPQPGFTGARAGHPGQAPYDLPVGEQTPSPTRTNGHEGDGDPRAGFDKLSPVSRPLTDPAKTDPAPAPDASPVKPVSPLVSPRVPHLDREGKRPAQTPPPVRPPATAPANPASPAAKAELAATTTGVEVFDRRLEPKLDLKRAGTRRDTPSTAANAADTGGKSEKWSLGAQPTPQASTQAPAPDTASPSRSEALLTQASPAAAAPLAQASLATPTSPSALADPGAQIAQANAPTTGSSPTTPASESARIDARIAPQVESAIENLAEAREAGRRVRPELNLRHAEFGAINVRLEAAGGDLRATLNARDPGFVPAVQAALAERAVSGASETSSSTNQRGQDQSTAQSGTHSQSGAQSEGRYGSSTGSGKALSEPYSEQTGSSEDEPTTDPRSAQDAAPLSGSQAGGLFA